MTFMRIAAFLVLLATIALVGCTNTNSQYQTPARGGWDNFRADAAPGRPGLATDERTTG